MRLGLSLVGVLALLVAGAHAAEETVTLKSGLVTGIVVEADGVTLAAGVKVALKRADTGALAVEAVSDEEGAFRLSDLRPGTYRLIISGSDAGLVRVEDEGAVQRLTILLPEAQTGAAPGDDDARKDDDDEASVGPGGYPWSTWAIVGAGAAATIVPLAIAIADIADSDPVSP